MALIASFPIFFSVKKYSRHFDLQNHLIFSHCLHWLLDSGINSGGMHCKLDLHFRTSWPRRKATAQWICIRSTCNGALFSVKSRPGNYVKILRFSVRHLNVLWIAKTMSLRWAAISKSPWKKTVSGSWGYSYRKARQVDIESNLWNSLAIWHYAKRVWAVRTNYIPLNKNCSQLVSSCALFISFIYFSQLPGINCHILYIVRKRKIY